MFTVHHSLFSALTQPERVAGQQTQSGSGVCNTKAGSGVFSGWFWTGYFPIAIHSALMFTDPIEFRYAVKKKRGGQPKDVLAKRCKVKKKDRWGKLTCNGHVSYSLLIHRRHQDNWLRHYTSWYGLDKDTHTHTHNIQVTAHAEGAQHWPISANRLLTLQGQSGVPITHCNNSRYFLDYKLQSKSCISENMRHIEEEKNKDTSCAWL